MGPHVVAADCHAGTAVPPAQLLPSAVGSLMMHFGACMCIKVVMRRQTAATALVGARVLVQSLLLAATICYLLHCSPSTHSLSTSSFRAERGIQSDVQLDSVSAPVPASPWACSLCRSLRQGLALVLPSAPQQYLAGGPATTAPAAADPTAALSAAPPDLPSRGATEMPWRGSALGATSSSRGPAAAAAPAEGLAASALPSLSDADGSSMDPHWLLVQLLLQAVCSALAYQVPRAAAPWLLAIELPITAGAAATLGFTSHLTRLLSTGAWHYLEQQLSATLPVVAFVLAAAAVAASPLMCKALWVAVRCCVTHGVTTAAWGLINFLGVRRAVASPQQQPPRQDPRQQPQPRSNSHAQQLQQAQQQQDCGQVSQRRSNNRLKQHNAPATGVATALAPHAAGVAEKEGAAASTTTTTITDTGPSSSAQGSINGSSNCHAALVAQRSFTGRLGKCSGNTCSDRQRKFSGASGGSASTQGSARGSSSSSNNMRCSNWFSSQDLTGVTYGGSVTSADSQCDRMRQAPSGLAAILTGRLDSNTSSTAGGCPVTGSKQQSKTGSDSVATPSDGQGSTKAPTAWFLAALGAASDTVPPSFRVGSGHGSTSTSSSCAPYHQHPRRSLEAIHQAVKPTAAAVAAVAFSTQQQTPSELDLGRTRGGEAESDRTQDKDQFEQWLGMSAASPAASPAAAGVTHSTFPAVSQCSPADAPVLLPQQGSYSSVCSRRGYATLQGLLNSHSFTSTPYTRSGAVSPAGTPVPHPQVPGNFTTLPNFTLGPTHAQYHVLPGSMHRFATRDDSSAVSTRTSLWAEGAAAADSADSCFETSDNLVTLTGDLVTRPSSFTSSGYCYSRPGMPQDQLLDLAAAAAAAAGPHCAPAQLAGTATPAVGVPAAAPYQRPSGLYSDTSSALAAVPQAMAHAAQRHEPQLPTTGVAAAVEAAPGIGYAAPGSSHLTLPTGATSAPATSALASSRAIGHTAGGSTGTSTRTPTPIPRSRRRSLRPSFDFIDSLAPDGLSPASTPELSSVHHQQWPHQWTAAGDNPEAHQQLLHGPTPLLEQLLQQPAFVPSPSPSPSCTSGQQGLHIGACPHQSPALTRLVPGGCVTAPGPAADACRLTRAASCCLDFVRVFEP